MPESPQNAGQPGIQPADADGKLRPRRLPWRAAMPSKAVGQSGFHPRSASITKKPATYAAATCQPWRNQRTTDFVSGYMPEMATPAEEPNQIIEPPKPTA